MIRVLQRAADGSCGCAQRALVPGPTVELGIAPAGTDPSVVPLTVSAQVGGDDSFTGTLDASGLEGDHVVVAKACYGAGSCGVASTEVTLP